MHKNSAQAKANKARIQFPAQLEGSIVIPESRKWLPGMRLGLESLRFGESRGATQLLELVYRHFHHNFATGCEALEAAIYIRQHLLREERGRLELGVVILRHVAG